MEGEGERDLSADGMDRNGVMTRFRICLFVFKRSGRGRGGSDDVLVW